MKSKTTTLVLLGAWLGGCSDPISEPTIDRTALLTALADDVIIPEYERLSVAAAALESSASALCESRTAAALDATQEAWLEVRKPWRRAEVWQLGPVRDLRIANAIEFLPLRAGDVDEVLAGSEPITDAYVSSLGVSARGLPVLEYLLFDLDGGDAAVLAELGDAAPSRRCVYVEALVADVSSQADRLYDAWKSDGGNYRAELVNAGSGSSEFMNQQRAYDRIVNMMIETLQLLEGERLAKPLGRRDAGVPQLDAIEVRRSGAAVADLLAGVEGVDAVYRAALAPLVAPSNPTLDVRIAGQIESSKSAIEALAPSLEDAITTDAARVEAAFLATRTLLRLVAADLASQLGVTTTFSDNDGD